MTAELPATDDVDPFEEFNRSAGMGIVDDPHPLLAQMRAQAPLVREALGTPDANGESEMGADAPALFTAVGFAAAQQILRDGATFSSSGYAAVMGEVFGHSILEMDEPEHHTYRGLVQQAFSRRAMERWETDIVEPVVDARIAAFADRGSAELVRELTFPFPVEVIAGMLGLPTEDLPRFHRWAVEIISVAFDMERARRASETLYTYYAGLIAERRDDPRHDVISVLAGAELDGTRLTDDEIIAFLRLLLPAGAETTYRSSSNLLHGLLTHPDQLDAVRRDRSLVPQAIEEGVRWEPPLLIVVRTATRDTVVEGIEIPAGSIVIVNVGSANRDEGHWERPHEYDLFREPRPHVAFASGPHMCLGMHLARMETRVVLERLLDRFPDLRLDPDAEPAPITGNTFRAPGALPVVWQ